MMRTRAGFPIIAAALLCVGAASAEPQGGDWERAAASGTAQVASIRDALSDAVTRIEGVVAPNHTDVLFEASETGGFSLELGFGDQATATLFRCRKGPDDDICDDIKFVFPQLTVDRAGSRILLRGNEIARLNESRGYRIILPNSVTLVTEISTPASKTTTIYAQGESFAPVSVGPANGVDGAVQRTEYRQVETFAPVSVETKKEPGEAGGGSRVRVFLKIGPRQ